jgi:hypothetical protein
MHWYRLTVPQYEVEAHPALQSNPAVPAIARYLSCFGEATRGEILEAFGATLCYDFGLAALDRMVKLRLVHVRLGDEADTAIASAAAKKNRTDETRGTYATAPGRHTSHDSHESHSLLSI